MSRDYGYFGKGYTGYAQYMTAFKRTQRGGGGGGGGGNGGGAGCFLVLLGIIVLLAIISPFLAN